MSNAPYILPKICCRCGENKITHMRLIQGSELTGVGYFVLFIATQRSNYSFSVPVCDDCSIKLDWSYAFTKIFRLVVAVLITVGFLYEFIVSGYLLAGIILSILIYGILHLSLVMRPINQRSLGGFTGKYFWFSNMNFYQEFAALNPSLVRPQDLGVLTPRQHNTNSDSQKKDKS